MTKSAKFSTSNVGLGTTTPNRRLAVDGDAAVGGELLLDDEQGIEFRRIDGPGEPMITMYSDNVPNFWERTVLGYSLLKRPVELDVLGIATAGDFSEPSCSLSSQNQAFVLGYTSGNEGQLAH